MRLPLSSLLHERVHPRSHFTEKTCVLERLSDRPRSLSRGRGASLPVSRAMLPANSKGETCRGQPRVTHRMGFHTHSSHLWPWGLSRAESRGLSFCLWAAKSHPPFPFSSETCGARIFQNKPRRGSQGCVSQKNQGIQGAQGPPAPTYSPCPSDSLLQRKGAL